MKKAQKIGETLPRLLKSLGTCHLQAWHRISLYSGLMIGLVLLLIGCTGIMGPKNPVLVKLTIHYVNESADTVLMHIRGEFAAEKKLAPGASRKEIVDIELWDQTDGTKTMRVLRIDVWMKDGSRSLAHGSTIIMHNYCDSGITTGITNQSVRAVYTGSSNLPLVIECP